MVDLTDEHMQLDISRANKLLNWEPKHRLKNSLPKIIENLKDHPVKWYKGNDLKLPSKLKGK